MPTYLCSRCNQPVSAMTRDVTTGLCPTCRAADARAVQAETLEGLRQFENRILRSMLLPLPKAWCSRLEPSLSRPRFRGFLKLVSGLIVAVITFLLTIGIGKLTGVYVASALVGLPLAISMVGLMEIVLGINFADLADQFDRGDAFEKITIAIVVLAFVAIYLAGAVLIYRR
jgi:hypothetical protein